MGQAHKCYASNKIHDKLNTCKLRNIFGGQKRCHKKRLKIDTKGVIRICLSKKIRKHNCQNKKYKRANIDLQNIHIKLKIEKHEPHYKPGVNSGAPEG